MNRSLMLMGSFLLWMISVNTGITIASDDIKIGAIFAKSGIAARDGLYSFQAVRFAVKEINKQGGLLGKKLTLLEYDNHSIPIHSKIMAKRAIKANVVAVIGSAWSSLSLAIAPVLQNRGVPMVSPASTNPKLTKIGDYIYRVCFTDAFQGKILAQFARRDLQAKTVIIFTDISSDYSLGFSRIFREQFKKMHGKILLELEYKHQQDDFRALLKQAKRTKPDILFTSGHAESGLILKQAQQIGISAVMIGGDGWEARDFLVEGGLELKHGYFTTHWSEKVENELSRKFVTNYRKYNELNAISALAYDAVRVLAEAIRKAGSPDRSKIREALAQIKDFHGVTGRITFDENGDPVKSIVIKQIRNGQVQYFKTITP